MNKRRIAHLEELKSKKLIFKGLEAKTPIIEIVAKVCEEKLNIPTSKTINERIEIKDKWMRCDKDKKLVCGNQNTYGSLKELYKTDSDSSNTNYNVMLNNLTSKN